jgi:tRNA(adenine34) deaminase
LINKLPHYLAQKLATLNLADENLIHRHGYLEIYAQLKLAFPSLNYQALFDLFGISQGASVYRLSPELQQELITRFKALPPRHPWLSQEVIDRYLHDAEMQAKIALSSQEVPIGAVIVHQNKVIGRGYNRTRIDNNILQHAEVVAITDAQIYLGNYRLDECDLFVTIEPCLMCCGAIINSRIRRVIFGATEPKTGACHSQYNVFNNKKTNHHCEVIGPINNQYYGQVLKDFFKSK